MAPAGVVVAGFGLGLGFAALGASTDELEAALLGAAALLAGALEVEAEAAALSGWNGCSSVVSWAGTAEAVPSRSMAKPAARPFLPEAVTPAITRCHII
ncbi:MAG TPA: hypothetical protein VG839_04180 [Asticcacaulis sp.]|nr:hypothetical protein [Asticcacaulis sp.]